MANKRRDLSIWNPFKELEALRDEIDKFFNFDINGESKLIAPAVDIYEDDSNLYVKADLPGMKKEEIDLEINEGYLTIKGTKESVKEEEDKKKHYYRKERWYGAFERTIALPDFIDVEKASATFKDGVLEITLPKKEEKKPKKIDIKIK